jgi:hypothetical protein
MFVKIGQRRWGLIGLGVQDHASINSTKSEYAFQFFIHYGKVNLDNE